MMIMYIQANQASYVKIVIRHVRLAQTSLWQESYSNRKKKINKKPEHKMRTNFCRHLETNNTIIQFKTNNPLTVEIFLGESGSSEDWDCSETAESADILSISLRATNHLLSSWLLSTPLNETEASSNLLTVCLKLL